MGREVNWKERKGSIGGLILRDRDKRGGKGERKEGVGKEGRSLPFQQKIVPAPLITTTSDTQIPECGYVRRQGRKVDLLRRTYEPKAR